MMETEARTLVTVVIAWLPRIDLRYTTLVQGDTRFPIPNSTLFTNAIAFHGRPGERSAGREASRQSARAGVGSPEPNDTRE
jgi:hypothetical protein